MKPWTYAEQAELRRLAPTHTAEQIGALLHRTSHAVHQQAYKLKGRLQKAGDQNHGTKYSDALVEQIRTMHELGTKPAAIARETGVPIGNVKAFVYYRNRSSASLALLKPAQGPA